MPRIVAMLLSCVLLGAPGARAAVPEVPRFRLLGVADGLPSSMVNAIARDRAGYVWIATLDGLARYDGVGFRIWRHVPGDPRSLPGNNVQALHVDARDRVWVATEFGGISMLGAAREGFVHYRRATLPAIASDDAWAFASGGGALWFGTADGGLHRLDARGRISRWTTREGLPSDTILALAFDARGTLWIGTDAGLARWDGTRMQAAPLPGVAGAAMVYSLTRDGDRVWAGTAAGVFVRGAQDAWSAPAWSSMFERPNAMLALAGDDDGALWLGSQRGLWRLRGDGVPTPVALAGARSGKPVLSLLRQQGGLWAPVQGAGLAYLRSDWRRLAQFSREGGVLATDQYRAVAPSARGGVWIAGREGVVEHLGADGVVAPLAQSGRGALARVTVTAVAEDRTGRLWLGHRGGLLRVDGGRVDAWGPAHPVYPVPEGQVDLLQVAPDGTLWLSAQGGGIQQRDPRTGAVIAQVLSGEDPVLGAGDTEAMAFDAAGRPWIAGGSGLARWDALHGRFTLVPAMRGARVHAFDFDGPDALWLHRVTGLEGYRRDGDRWTRIATVGGAQQLPAIESSALRVDGRHRVWLSTRRGLFRWDPRARLLRHVGVEDGLLGQEFVDRALALTTAGTLAATTMDGAVVLLDTQAPESRAPAAALRIDGVDVRRGGRWRELPPAPVHVLSPGEAEWRVRLRLLSYDAPAAAHYWTRLEGFDRGWVLQDGGERVFTGLPPGAYRLRVRASDAAGTPAAEQVLRLRVLPPWWRSGWMAAGLLVLAAVLVWRVPRMWQARRAQADRVRRIRRERELARAASRATSDFLATFGHEVRTPMTGVLGMTELLLATPLSGPQRGHAESILAAGRHLLRLLDDALDLARIEAGRLELLEAEFDLHALLAEVQALYAPLAQAKGITFECALDAGLPRRFHGDVHRVRQILLNLCGNAVKFTDAGRITLSARPLARGVQLQVRDTGPGLDAQAQARLFRRFEQAQGGGTAARHGGSGLGLAICRELAVAMGGAIDVDSRPGEGTCFRVDLPLRITGTPAGDAHRACSAPGPRRTLLLVEDDALVAQAVCGLLEAQGHAVVHAPHALAALSALRERRFDLAVLDLDLPGMDGVALAGLLRAQGQRLPLLALTARTDPGAEAAARTAGMEGFLRKPVTGEQLGGAIERLWDGVAAVVAAPAPA